MKNKHLRRVQKGTAYGLIVCAAVLWFWPNRSDYALLPDTGGSIQKVVCSVNSARRALLANAQLANHIINHLPAYTEVILAVNAPSAFRVAYNPFPGRVRFFTVPSDAEMTIWPQDPFLVLCHPSGRKKLLLSAMFERADDLRVAQLLREYLGWPVRQSRFIFEGGNIVSDEEFVYIGSDTIVLNAAQRGQDAAQTVRQFEKELGRRIWVVGPSPQPIGHLDMMLAPLGQKRIILADPNWGAELAQHQLEQSAQEVSDFEERCRQMFFGDGRSAVLYAQQGQILNPPKIEGLTGEAVKHCRNIAPVIDRIAAEFVRNGFEVIRIPYLTVRRQTENAEPPSESKRILPSVRYPEITYTNVLQESEPEGRRVYLPLYGWTLFDKTAASVWEKTGFQVIGIDGFTISTMYGGSLRYCTKVLERSY